MNYMTKINDDLIFECSQYLSESFDNRSVISIKDEKEYRNIGNESAMTSYRDVNELLAFLEAFFSLDRDNDFQLSTDLSDELFMLSVFTEAAFNIIEDLYKNNEILNKNKDNIKEWIKYTIKNNIDDAPYQLSNFRKLYPQKKEDQ